jgi:hypothetical protein
MKSTIMIAGILLTGGQAMANTNPLPDVCKTVANIAAQALEFRSSDDDAAKTVTLTEDLVHFPVTKAVYLGNCDDDHASLKQAWCRVGGGSPDVYRVEVSDAEDSAGKPYPIATMVVTFNRGGCWVDSAERK